MCFRYSFRFTANGNSRGVLFRCRTAMGSKWVKHKEWTSTDMTYVCMNVFMCMYMYMYMYMWMCVYVHENYVNVMAYAFVCMTVSIVCARKCEYVCKCEYVSICEYVYICEYVCTCEYVYMCMYVCMCMSVYVYVSLCAYIWISTWHSSTIWVTTRRPFPTIRGWARIGTCNFNSSISNELQRSFIPK